MWSVGVELDVRTSLPRSSSTDTDSWAFVTVHKAASSYVGSLLAELFRARGVPQVDLAGSAFANNLEESAFCIENEQLLRIGGHYYGPFRNDGGYVASMPSLRKTKLIIHVRDPRDCIVSLHYSVAFSHLLPSVEGPIRDEMIAQRKLYSGRTVDESALADCDSFRKTFESLRDLRDATPSAYISKYTDMVTDFDKWLDGICAFTRCGDLSEVKERLRRAANFNVEEDPFSHKRQVIPGDFRRKLAPDTQRELTARLGQVLDAFGYPR